MDLTQNEYRNFMELNLPANLKGGITSAPNLAVRWPCLKREKHLQSGFPISIIPKKIGAIYSSGRTFRIGHHFQRC